ncbi:protein LURP-one-related 5-like protein [Carex littledalei]|uniref:Protein LURP-one-related 5-like protein n=1 Tax=Carex littledalei TaxID=544730 RepID=A0A833RBD8_9POAL|nr:protein LURP-one-related 5-like protein [Carex littledalei]
MMSRMQVQQQHAESSKPTNVDKPRVFTVWQKSSMGFQGTDGFSVYDDTGRLVFRVDNYSRRQKCLTKEIVLMDGVGNPLLWLRPQILSLHDRWNAYEVEECGNKQPDSRLFSMKRYSMLHNFDKAEVSLRNLSDINNKSKSMPSFRIDGCCFEKNSCKISDNRGNEVAQISRKTTLETSVLLGNDVFSLVIQPGFDCKLVVAFVIVMDRIR